MFRQMRRFKQEAGRDEAVRVLEGNSCGVLAVAGDDGYPYTVPTGYAYINGRLYFHSAVAGHKLDAIARSDKVSFCVVDRDDVEPARFTTVYSSVVVFGRARLLTDDGDKLAAMKAISAKYSPGLDAEAAAKAEHSLPRYAIIELTPEHITCKQSMELINAGS